jgi:endonuclease YncB( thermonuclease family)
MERLLVMAALALLSLMVVASVEPISAERIQVKDGDTISAYHYPPDVRLVGFNAPEISRARCASERALGVRARDRLIELVVTAKLDFEYVACSCATGTEGTMSCNFGRDCGILRANGTDVGVIQIAEGLAVPFECGENKCPKTPRPWCSAAR